MNASSVDIFAINKIFIVKMRYRDVGFFLGSGDVVRKGKLGKGYFGVLIFHVNVM